LNQINHKNIAPSYIDTLVLGDPPPQKISSSPKKCAIFVIYQKKLAAVSVITQFSFTVLRIAENSLY
jgi:hypothetical protein